MTLPLPSRHAESGAPLANPALVTAGLAACLGVPGPELALIVEGREDQLATLPASAARGRVGYAVDAVDGTIFPPGMALPSDRRLFASVRIKLPHPADGPEPVLHALSMLSGNGWRLNVLPNLVPALDRSLSVLRARPEDIGGVNEAPAGIDGTGVLLGVVDFGCDFAHPAFRDANGQTRLLFLWDQNGEGAGPVPGVLREGPAIQAALGAPDPYAALGYWPDRNQYAPGHAREKNPVHGTHVLGVAAGRGVPGCPAGVAPGASLAFVHLQPGAMVGSGDPADVFDGVCAIFHRAAERGMPAVVNLSLGANNGSHDGNTLYDRALDALLAWPGRAIAVAAGNERRAKLNIDGDVRAGSPFTLPWRFLPGDRTPNTLRIFSKNPGPRLLLKCTVRLGGANLATEVDEVHNAVWLGDSGKPRGLLYSGLAPVPEAASPLQHIEIRLRPSGGAERVEVTLATDSAEPVAFDAWIDRDDREEASQSFFDLEPPKTDSTLTSTACGRRTVCVGAFYHRRPELAPAEFSGEGMTRDLRPKPDVSAPGFDVLAAAAYGGRLEPGQVWSKALAVKMSGTSAAAPHAAGVLALMLQCNPQLSAEKSSAILRKTAQLRGAEGSTIGWHAQLGCGRINAAAALAQVRP